MKSFGLPNLGEPFKLWALICFKYWMTIPLFKYFRIQIFSRHMIKKMYNSLFVYQGQITHHKHCFSFSTMFLKVVCYQWIKLCLYLWKGLNTDTDADADKDVGDVYTNGRLSKYSHQHCKKRRNSSISSNNLFLIKLLFLKKKIPHYHSLFRGRSLMFPL